MHVHLDEGNRFELGFYWEGMTQCGDWVRGEQSFFLCVSVLAAQENENGSHVWAMLLAY